MTTNKHSQGFSLLEMSVVLVIIGLLIGAVIKGQELIYQANLKATAKQWNQTITAWNLFKDKFDAIPGDYEAASGFTDPTAVDGDGDGIIEANSGSTTGSINEMGNTWEHLRLAGFLTNYNEDGLPGRLKAKIDDAEFWMVTDKDTDNEPDDGFANDGLHYIHLRKVAGLIVPTNISEPFTRREAITQPHVTSLERKYDDENKDDGEIRYACKAYEAIHDHKRICYMQFKLSNYD
ncbi:MAG: prepilin-type N-terminal cleavage/methylation domain-containing protein [Alphaproteobacteria bacterium]|nr:prepilin-type N-terminal cleavage/methylation domain-containing protein [Alphaproteobacteria bacterium]